MNDKQPSDITGQTSAVRAQHAPSKPWFGAVILACLALATVWVLTYTLTPLPGQRTLGGWNYVVVGLLLTAFIGLARLWHGDPPERSERR
jgi:hypothetical protein